MSEDEKAALKGWKEYHKAIKKYNLDTDPQYPKPIDRMYDGWFAGFYAGRDHEKSKYPQSAQDKARSAAYKVLHGKGRSKKVKTARGSALTQRGRA